MGVCNSLPLVLAGGAAAVSKDGPVRSQQRLLERPSRRAFGAPRGASRRRHSTRLQRALRCDNAPWASTGSSAARCGRGTAEQSGRQKPRGRARGRRMTSVCALPPSRVSPHDRNPTFAMFRRRIDQRPLRADIFPTGIVRSARTPPQSGPRGQSNSNSPLAPEIPINVTARSHHTIDRVAELLLQASAARAQVETPSHHRSWRTGPRRA